MPRNTFHKSCYSALLLLTAVFTGCATPQPSGRSSRYVNAPQNLDSVDRFEAPSTTEDTAASGAPETVLVAHQESGSADTAPALGLMVTEPALETAYSLADLESMALSTNPTLRQSQAQVAAAQGAAYQAGLFPNPVVGYEAEFDQISGARNERWNGGFISQEVVTGGKLELSRNKWSQRVRIARTNLHAQQHRVINDVRVQFYRTLAAQELVAVYQELVTNGEDKLQTYREMLNVGQTNQSGLLAAEVDLQADRLNLIQADQELQHAWRMLASYVGVSELGAATLEGSLYRTEGPLDWDSAFAQLISSSPELVAAHQIVQHDRLTVLREEAEPIPNLLFDVTTIQSPDSDTTQTVLNVGLPLPVFDRNQGTVQQAQADLRQSHAEARRLELELRTRLATQFRDYQTAWQRLLEYESNMIPKAKQAYDLLHESYKARRAAWPDVLAAQRQYLMLRADRTTNALMFCEADVAVRGMLLTGGLTTPQAPIGAGHIDSVAKPR